LSFQLALQTAFIEELAQKGRDIVTTVRAHGRTRLVLVQQAAQALPGAK
jgi:hypothetical protein